MSERQDRIHRMATDKGWWPELTVGSVDVRASLLQKAIPEKLCLIHSEISEALEEHRNGKPLEYQGEHGKPEGLAVELADAVIRIEDLCGALGIDLDAVIERKIAYNATRSHRHGGKRC